MKLQLALDCRDLDEMRSKLEAVADFVDIIEIETLLIMCEGMEAVCEVRHR